MVVRVVVVIGVVAGILVAGDNIVVGVGSALLERCTLNLVKIDGSYKVLVSFRFKINGSVGLLVRLGFPRLNVGNAYNFAANVAFRVGIGQIRAAVGAASFLYHNS